MLLLLLLLLLLFEYKVHTSTSRDVAVNSTFSARHIPFIELKSVSFVAYYIFYKYTLAVSI
jgi:hypothetical protein